MIFQVLSKNWVDKSKTLALETVKQYAEFLGLKVEKPNFRAYNNTNIFVPNPNMIHQFIYRLRSIKLRAIIMIAIETSASASEINNLKWNDVNLESKTIVIRGVKGHKSFTYQISDELITLLSQLPRSNERVFNYADSRYLNDFVRDYRKRLFKETNNPDFLKIHFHTFRHYAISWFYFKTKDIVATQRFARHSNIQNTLRYVHIVQSWIRENEYNVVYAESKEELTKYLSEGYEYVTKTEWGYCLKILNNQFCKSIYTLIFFLFLLEIKGKMAELNSKTENGFEHQYLAG
ncbi:MAG: site-specific integrase [Candidatus Bathyarchaeia archaeon]